MTGASFLRRHFTPRESREAGPAPQKEKGDTLVANQSALLAHEGPAAMKITGERRATVKSNRQMGKRQVDG